MRSSLMNVVALALALAAASCLPSAALVEGAGAPAIERPAAAAVDAPRIESFAVPGSGIERVRATVVVSAPIERVRAVVFDYARYPEFMPRYEKAAVVKVTPDGGRVVRMELGGIVHLWMRVEISPPRISGATEAYEGRLVDGNIKAFAPRWELEALEGGRTRVTVESFLDPDLMLVPSSMINSGARDGVREAIVALKARIEGREAAR